MFVIKHIENKALFIYCLFICMYACRAQTTLQQTLAKNMIGRYRSFKIQDLPLLEMYLRYPSYHSVKINETEKKRCLKRQPTSFMCFLKISML